MAIIGEILNNHSLVDQIDKYVCANKAVFREEDSKSCYNWMSLRIGTQERLDAVLWKQNQVSFIKSKNDIVSFGFSGCIMAKIRFSNGRTECAHVHCDSVSGCDSRKYFAAYLLANSRDISSLHAFRPVCRMPDIVHKQFRHQRSVWGVITKDDCCYSIVIDKVGQRCFLHKIFEHEPYGHRLTDYSHLLAFQNTDSSFENCRDDLDAFWKSRGGYERYFSERFMGEEEEVSEDIGFPEDHGHRCLVI